MQAPAPPVSRSPVGRFTSWLSHLWAERTFVLALLLVIPALLPLAAPGYFFGAHDGRHTVFWLLEFDRAFSDGALVADLGARSRVGVRLSALVGVCAALLFRSRSVSPVGIGPHGGGQGRLGLLVHPGRGGDVPPDTPLVGTGRRAGRCVGLHLRALSLGGHLRARRACRIRRAGDSAVGSARAGERLGKSRREERGAGCSGARRAAVDAQHGPGGLRPAGRGFRCLEGVASGS